MEPTDIMKNEIKSRFMKKYLMENRQKIRKEFFGNFNVPKLNAGSEKNYFWSETPLQPTKIIIVWELG